MNDVTITRHRTVLQYQEIRSRLDTDTILFYNDDSERYYYIPRDKWVEMGEPRVITLTIEPGDLLNV